MHQQFDTPDPVELVLELGSGSATITAIETSQSTVEISGPRAEEFTVELEGRRLTVLAPRHGVRIFGGNDSHQVTVTLPTGSDLTTRTGSADVDATGRLGAVRSKSGSGQVEIEDAEGSVVIDTGSGDVSCGSVGDALRVRTGSGEVEVGQVGGSAAVSTGSGDVALGRTTETTVVKTGSGSGTVQRSSGQLTLKTGSGSLTVGHAERGSIRASTSSGDVRVGVPAGTPVWTDISCASGRIRSDLPSLGKPEDGQDHVELRIRTASGDITLAQV
ncbi:DUF4097 family beta strand repeat-containing protein [Nocardioides terrisoli]|uniref:DUF4097 family beta strand repeat-containing protein n=1 Tax=Nocardioides terrisoli TaxID=3388267 RepID=UPI00287B7467|nr:DUF4097 family beta strand repeat-containing protein [Nocardioides marmorisolisilvae]